MSVKIVSIEGSITTNYAGHNALMNFYHSCKKYQNQTIQINFYKLKFFDANLCALLSAILHKLNKENNLLFVTDIDYLKGDFNVLCRNGFLKSDPPIVDLQKSTIAFKAFHPKDKKGFFEYIENDLMKHRGMPKLSEELYSNIIDDLVEIFVNYDYHSKSRDYFFVCGQYYGKTKFLKLTLVDLGDGFLPSIKKATNGVINKSNDAVLWALGGHSTKPKFERVPGGLGIKGIHQFVTTNNGIFDIATGETYWSSAISDSKFPNRCINIDKPFCGTTINLSFNCN